MSVAPDNDFSIPAGTIVLDKYEVVETLGIGGMGLVVKAIHTALHTPVAIKFLLPQYTVSSEASRRFIREAQAASKIASDHIVRVFDTGSSHPYGPYIVMEFMQGVDLSRHVRQKGAVSIEDAIDYIVQACLALAEAHAHGIIHRDVKPANLFMIEQAEGTSIKVLDFGISKVAEQTSLEVTKTTAILGSGLYMSPEQMKSSKTVDHRTDVYALGITLYELLTRTQPFTADSFAELAIKVNMEPPTDLRKFRPDVPEGLAMAIAAAYAKKAEDRYQTVGELAAALAPWASARTKLKIEALARREMRRSIGSLPKTLQLTSRPPNTAGQPTTNEAGQPKSFPPALLESNMRIPPPPSLPSPSSMGMDTFGLSQPKRAPDSLTQTADQSLSVDKGTKGGVGNMLSVGVGVGIILALGTAGFLFFRKPTPRVTKPPPAMAASADASGLPSATGTAVSTATPTNPDVTPTGDPTTNVSASAPGTTKSGEPVIKSSGGGATTTSTQPTTTVAPTTAPTTQPTVTPTAPTSTATGTDQPCKMRDMNGNLIDCP